MCLWLHFFEFNCPFQKLLRTYGEKSHQQRNNAPGCRHLPQTDHELRGILCLQKPLDGLQSQRVNGNSVRDCNGKMPASLVSLNSAKSTRCSGEPTFQV